MGTRPPHTHSPVIRPLVQATSAQLPSHGSVCGCQLGSISGPLVKLPFSHSSSCLSVLGSPQTGCKAAMRRSSSRVAMMEGRWCAMSGLHGHLRQHKAGRWLDRPLPEVRRGHCPSRPSRSEQDCMQCVKCAAQVCHPRPRAGHFSSSAQGAWGRCSRRGRQNRVAVPLLLPSFGLRRLSRVLISEFDSGGKTSCRETKRHDTTRNVCVGQRAAGARRATGAHPQHVGRPTL